MFDQPRTTPGTTRQTGKVSSTFRLLFVLPAVAALLSAPASQALAYANPGPIVLLSAADFTILAKTGISTSGVTSITGDIGVSPALAVAITGFSQTMDSSNQFSTSIYVAAPGKIYAPDYSAPTPAKMTQAVSDMEAAYTNAAGRAADTTGLGTPPGSIGGLTFVRGVYQWSSNVNIASNIYLSGDATDVWIFQIAGNLDLASNAQVILSGGALAQNVFWQVAGQTTLQTTSVMNGTILCMTAIVMQNGATLNGKALAQAAVTLIANTVKSGYTGSNPPALGQAFAFPSPAKGDLINLAYNMRESGKASIKVWNENGDLVATHEEQKRFGPQLSLVSIRGFAAGVYLYRTVLTYDSGKVERTGVQKFAVIR